MARAIAKVSITSGNWTRVETSAFAESPGPKRYDQQRQRDGRKRYRKPCHPVGDAEHFVTNRYHPVDERRFFEVQNTVEPGGDPISTRQHCFSNLRLDGVDVVH